MDQQSRTEVLDDLTTATWYSVLPDIIDQVFKITPFYDRMTQRNRILSKAPEGTHWEVPVRYAKLDQNTKWFGRGDSFSKSEKEHLTRLVFYAKNLGTAMVRYKLDELKNRGKAQLIDYAKEVVETTRLSFQDTLAESLLVQSADPLSIDALPTIITSTPTTGSYGGLTRSSNAYLQNQIKDFSGLTTGTDLLDEMTRMYHICSEFKGNSGSQRTPDMILTTRAIYQDYERICRAMQQIVTNTTVRASLGFGDLMFKNVEMFYDPNCPSGCMYFLNTDTFSMPYDPAAWFTMTEWKQAQDNLDRVAQVYSVCQLYNDAPQKNGVIFSITATTD